jgi:hypothetical protein
MTTHPYFGKLDTQELDSPEICWQTQRVINGVEFEVWLWVDRPELDRAKLDYFAAFLSDLEEADGKARQQLRDYLHANPDYITHHAEMTDSAALRGATAADGSIAVEDFVRAMKITRISLWHAEGYGKPITMDYMIDQSLSDEILVVQIEFDGTTSIGWES